MRISAAGNDVARTLAARAAALPITTGLPRRAMAAGASVARCRRGFTLLELLVVVTIIAIATAGVSFALRDSQDTELEREAQRLAALLESARARSRSSGIPIRWYATEGGFRFEGLPANAFPDRWIADTTKANGAITLSLGPEPIIGPQEVVLVSSALPGRSSRVSTDGVHPFKVATGVEAQ
jgi:general secretion pathway protein H